MNREETLTWIEVVLDSLDDQEMMAIIRESADQFDGEFFATVESETERYKANNDTATAEQLHDCLHHLLDKAGNVRLMTPQLQTALCEHAAGNLRLLMNMANDLLAEAVRRQVDQIDEKLFFDTFDLKGARRTKS